MLGQFVYGIHKHDDVKVAFVERANHAHIECEAEVSPPSTGSDRGEGWGARHSKG